jgi:hypothetical protein
MAPADLSRSLVDHPWGTPPMASATLAESARRVI